MTSHYNHGSLICAVPPDQIDIDNAGVVVHHGVRKMRYPSLEVMCSIYGLTEVEVQALPMDAPVVIVETAPEPESVDFTIPTLDITPEHIEEVVHEQAEVVPVEVVPVEVVPVEVAPAVPVEVPVPPAPDAPQA